MNLAGSRARLGALTKELMVHWETTRDDWQDARALEFEKRFLTDLVSGVNRTLGQIENLERLLTQIHHDCE